MKNIFCHKCHQLTAQVMEKDGKTLIMQHGKVLISMANNVIVKGSGLPPVSRSNSVSVKCPCGHSVPISV